MRKNKQLDQNSQPETGNGNKADAIGNVGGASDSAEPKERKKYTRRAKVETPISFTDEQMALITSGLFAAMTGLLKMPFDKADPDIKKGFDMALANVANQYGGEFLQKYAPIFQLGICGALLTVDVMKKKKQGEAVEAMEVKADNAAS